MDLHNKFPIGVKKLMNEELESEESKESDPIPSESAALV